MPKYRAISAGPPFFLRKQYKIPLFPNDGLWAFNLDPLFPVGSPEAIHLWKLISDTHDIHWKPSRPHWWPPTKSDQWGEHPDFTQCPPFSWPKPR